VLAQGFLDPPGVRGANALADRQGLLPVRDSGAGVAVPEPAVAEAFQGACFLQRRADVAGDGQRLGVVVPGLGALPRPGQHRAQVVQHPSLRGAGGASAAELQAAGLPPETCAVDVTSYLDRKLGALARHRTQYPIVPSMLPESLLESMLGTEFFAAPAAAAGTPPPAGGRRRRGPDGRRAARRRGLPPADGLRSAGAT